MTNVSLPLGSTRSDSWRVAGCDLGISINKGYELIFCTSHRFFSLRSDIFRSSKSLSMLSFLRS